MLWFFTFSPTYHHKRSLTMAGLDRFIFVDFGQGPEDRLIKGQILKSCAIHVFNKLVNRQKGRLFVKHVFLLPFQINFAHFAIAIYKTDNKNAFVGEDAMGLPQGLADVINKADGRDH